MSTITTPEELAATARRLKQRVDHLKRERQHGHASYEELADAAKEYCRAFDAYSRARFGKPGRLDFRALIR